VRPDAIRTVDEDLRPILRPQALEMPGSTTNAKATSAGMRLTTLPLPPRPRARLGPPWTKDHRMALAATIVAG
jgi:hypothetical protein